MPNRLAHETSPYLLQHAENPVDWYPWGTEALERARAEGRPIFLSVGYSACHWCHVMEHESFDDPQIAGLLNENFVAVKVDREERPDLDQLYMGAVQALTGRGGWPMSVFLTPQLEPFFGGTYWPPHPRMGMPGFGQVLRAVAEAWKNRRDKVLRQAAQLTEALRDGLGAEPVRRGDAEISDQPLKTADVMLRRAYDSRYGGFGSAPKFPHPMDLRVLLRRWLRTCQADALEMVTHTLDKMAAGGIYDHLGGGFHRYSVDARWLVPHFEKMLYDNALLAGCYLEAYQATGNAEDARVVRETLDYVLRDMTDPAGGFYSTEDADSEGEEGKFYVWTPDEVATILGEDKAKTFGYVYDVSDVGNFEGRNILNLPKAPEQCAKILDRDLDELQAELAESRKKLLAVRQKRVRPSRDDKVLVAWNALMIDSLARAGAVLGESRYIEGASNAARFVLKQVRGDNGRLLHTWRGGHAKLDAYLDDYAGMADALVTLYEATFDERWIDEAVRLADTMLNEFLDPEQGGFFYTAGDPPDLLVRQKNVVDSSVPSATGLAATALVRLGKLTGRDDYLAAAEKTLQSCIDLMGQSPLAAGQLLLALDMFLGPTPEMAIVGGDDARVDAEVLSALRRSFAPNKVTAYRGGAAPSGHRSPALEPLFADKTPQLPGPTLYLCENFACQAPVSGKDAVLAALPQAPHNTPLIAVDGQDP